MKFNCKSFMICEVFRLPDPYCKECSHAVFTDGDIEFSPRHGFLNDVSLMEVDMFMEAFKELDVAQFTFGQVRDI